MSDFDEFVKKAGTTAKSAAKKTGDLYETAKLNWKIASEEEKMQDVFVKLGRMCYADHDVADCDDAKINELCAQVSELEASLRDLNNKLMKYKKYVRCRKCGKEFKESEIFCPVCGTKAFE